MGGKGKKKSKGKKQAASAAAEDEGGENGETNGTAKKGKGKGKKGKAGKSSKFQGDILSEAAMENAYYVCHNLMDVLKVGKSFYVAELLCSRMFISFRHVDLLGQNHKKRRKRERNKKIIN